MKKPLYKWLLGGLLVTAALVALALSQSRSFVEARLKSELAARGVEGINFHVSAIGIDGITLSDIDFGRGLTLESLTVGYRMLELMRGEVRDIETGVLVIKHEDTMVTLERLEIALKPTGKGLAGTWKVRSITVKDAPLDIPPLVADGTLSWENKRLKLEGDASSANGAYRSAFNLDYPLEEKDKALLVIESMAIPWQGGALHTRDVQVALFSPKPVEVRLELRKVSLGTLLQQATGDRATATGVVSGVLPVSIGRDGSFMLHAGKLQAEQDGTVALQPDAIPGDNAQVTLVRQILANFHYHDFTLAMDSDKANKLSMLLSLSGNNPDMYNGREVKLNVHLTGDVLSLFQQSIRLSDPTKLLQQREHEK